jgi:hypothetical protein
LRLAAADTNNGASKCRHRLPANKRPDLGA